MTGAPAASAHDGHAGPHQFEPVNVTVVETGPGTYEIHGTGGPLGKVAYRRGYSRWAIFDATGRMISGRHHNVGDALTALLHRVTRALSQKITSTHLDPPQA